MHLADVVTNGYWHARSLEFFEKHTYLEWLRLPGDVIFIMGVVPLLLLTAKASRAEESYAERRRTLTRSLALPKWKTVRDQKLDLR